MTAPFRGSGPWRGRGPFLGRGPWAGKAPFGFNAGLPFQISVTGAQLRDALATPSAWGETLGPELVSNGGFDSSTGWTLGNGGGSATISGGALILSGNNAAFPNAVQTGILVSGRVYQVVVSTTTTVAVNEVRISIGASTANGPSVTTAGTYTSRVTADGTALTIIRNSGYGGSTATITSISVREVVTGWLLPGLGGARLSGDCRTSVAMQTEADGTIGFAAHNLLTYSEDLTNAAWVKFNSTVVANAGVAPYGTTTADLVYPSSTGTNRTIYQTSSGATVVSSVAFYAKASGKSWVWILGPVGSGNTGVYFNVSTGVVGTQNAGYTGSITSVGNGWYRCMVAAPLAAMNYAQITVVDADNTDSVTTNGTDGILLWGAQLNLGPTALPYLPTTTAARYGPAIDWLSGIGSYGIRSEAARTNLVLYSTDLSNAAWTKSAAAVTQDGPTSPLGIASSKITASGLGGRAVQTVTATSTSHTFWALLKRENRTVNRLMLYNSTTAAVVGEIEFNLQTGVVAGQTVATGAIAAIGTGGWYLCEVRVSSGITVGNSIIGYVYCGTGTIANGDIVYCGHAQLEAGTEASSPILTYAAAATRAVDTLVVLDSGWINQTEGTLVADYVPRVAGTQLIAELDDATANERLSLTNDGIFTVIDGGVSQAAVDGGTPTAAALNKVAASYAANAFAVSLNNGAVVTDTAGTLPTVTRMDLNALDGHITRMRYSRRRANDGTLRSLST